MCMMLLNQIQVCHLYSEGEAELVTAIGCVVVVAIIFITAAAATVVLHATVVVLVIAAVATVVGVSFMMLWFLLL